MSEMFPRELTSLNQWICWRLEPCPDGGKDKKVPYSPNTGKKAATNKPMQWANFKNALAAIQQYNYSGLGFVFTKNDNLVGVDIDHCRNDDTGELSEAATSILERYPTYTEISPSGTGLHLLYKGTMPQGGNKNSKSGVEMYEHGRYFTMSGNCIENMPTDIAEDKGALDWIHKSFISTKGKPKNNRSKNRTPVTLSDEQIIAKAGASSYGDEFKRLWSGNWQDDFSSQSEADLSLCSKLAFWSGNNKEQIDRLFRISGLFREKWDTVHHSDGSTYGEETLKRAIENTTDTYSLESANPIFEAEGKYFRSKGDNVYPISNFIMNPVEMIVSDEETIIIADLLSVRGEVFRLSFMSTDFNNLQKFKGILNKRTISLSFLGSEGDLELLKGYISELLWIKKTGVKALGSYEYDGRWVFVSTDFAIESGGSIVEGIVQLEKYKSVSSDILSCELINQAKLKNLGELLLDYNEPAKTVSVLSWVAACFLKPQLKKEKIKFPHLFLIGEQGSGKSNTLEKVILPIFSRKKINAASQVSAFALMKESASSNLIPQPLDEFKPSKIDKFKLSILQNHFRDAYDGHEGLRGRADQSMVSYELLSPLIVAGEEPPEEPAIRERAIQLLFSKKDLKLQERKKVFKKIIASEQVLGDFGRSLLDIALGISSTEIKKWHEEATSKITEIVETRIINNLACCCVGLKLLNKLCDFYKLNWNEVFSISKEECIEHLIYAAKVYLLEGGVNNKSIIEKSLEIMARMDLDPNADYAFTNDGKHLAIRINQIYDKFTKYRKDHAINGECLSLQDFKNHLSLCDFYIQNDLRIYFGKEGEKKKQQRSWLLDYELLKSRCDISGFEITDVNPL